MTLKDKKIKPYKLFEVGGLYLEVIPNGTKSWRLKYRILKIRKTLHENFLAFVENAFIWRVLPFEEQTPIYLVRLPQIEKRQALIRMLLI